MAEDDIISDVLVTDVLWYSYIFFRQLVNPQTTSESPDNLYQREG